MKKSILILALSDVRSDARIRRQIEAFKKHYSVTLVCFDAEPSVDYERIILPQTRLTLWRKAFVSFFLVSRCYSIAYRFLHNYSSFIKHEFKVRNFDIVIANDVETLPLAFSFSEKQKVLFDAHEYAPRHFENRLMWRIFFQGFNKWMCKKYIPLVSCMTTVGKALAAEYQTHFHIKPVIITNASAYHDLKPVAVSENKIKLVHHGIANLSRRLDLMIDLMNLLDSRFTLDLYLLMPVFASKKTRDYINVLKGKAMNNPRIRILDPIKATELVRTIHSYDMGIFLLPPVNFNYKNALPNKFFDFIQARLGIAIGPTPEMAEIVKHYNNGVVSEDFTPHSLASKLNKLTKNDIEVFKENSHKAATIFNAENNCLLLREVVKGIIN